MFDVDKNDDKIYVVTYKELIFSLIIFSFILIQLYPKGILRDQIAADKKDYALTMVYLKDLMKHHPNDESLKVVFLEKKFFIGDYNTSLQLSRELIYAPQEWVRDKATLIGFDTVKIKYFQTENKHIKKQLYLEAKTLFSNIYTKKLYEDDGNASKWYDDARFVQHDRAKYFFLHQLLQEHPNDEKLLRDGYFLALKLGKERESFVLMDKLIEFDKRNAKEWVLVKYRAFLQYKQYSKAAATLESNRELSLDIKKELADFYLMMGEYRKASEIYHSLSSDISLKKQKEVYLRKAIQALQSGNLLDEAAQLVRKYEVEYINNRTMRTFFIHIYVAAGELNYASAYSKKILKHENRL